MSGKITYLFKEGIKNIWKNSFMSVASVGILVACLLIMGSFTLVSANINHSIEGLANDNEIAIFIVDTLSNEDAAAMESDIAAIPNVNMITFLSKEGAWEQFKEKNTEMKDLVEGMETSPLTNQFNITLKDIGQMHTTVTALKALPNVEKVRAREDIAQSLVKLKNMLNLIMIAFLGILVSISVFIISNTIKLGMFARRKEINIMKYVGATNGFIRFPFVVEGLAIGLISSGIAYGLQWYLYTYVVEKVIGGIELFEMLPFSTYSFYLLVAFLGAGLCVGLASSIVSIRKYLNV